MKENLWYVLFVVLLWVVLGLAGCAGMKAVDTTVLAQSVTAGEQHVTYTLIPGSIAGMPDNVLAIPTVPGKDLDFEAYWPTGGLQWKLTTRRSAVLDVLLSGLNEVDAAKFAADAATREWVMQVVDRVTAIAIPLLQSRTVGQAAPAAAEPGFKAEVKTMVLELVKAQLAAELAKLPLATQPVGGAP